jgi:hypothetical protein
MSNLSIIISPLADAEKVKTELQELLVGKSVVISDDPFAIGDVVITQYFSDLSKHLSGHVLDTLLERKDLLVQTHTQVSVGEHIGSLMNDENSDTAAISRISTNAFSAIAFANQIAKLNEKFIITTSVDHSFGEEMAFSDWLNRQPQVQETVTTEVKIEPEAPAAEVATSAETVVPAVVETDPVPVDDKTEIAGDGLGSTDTAPVVDEAFLDPLSNVISATTDPQPIVLEEISVNEVSETDTSTAVEEAAPLVELNSDMDSFDPLAQAFATSSQLANEEEPKPEPDLDASIYIGRLPDYPKVETTVEILKHPLVKKAKDEPSSEAMFYDWGGDVDSLTSELERLDRMSEEATQRKRRPNFTEQDMQTLACMSDRIGSRDIMNRMFTPQSKWSQALRTETKAIPLLTVVKNPNYGDQRYVGTDAVPLLANRMKIGVTIGVMLPHTGIYVLIVSPGDDEVLNTLSIINAQRVETLRSSSGILLGNSNYYLNKQIIDLFLNSVTDCSLTAHNREMLQKLIDDRDVDIIAAALYASIYPDGYDYTQVCGLELANHPGKICPGSQEFVADLKRMVFVDNSRLNEYQRNIATAGLTKRSVKEIEDYQSQHYLGWEKPYEITEGVQFIYKPVSSLVAIEAGEKWISEISSVVDRLIAFKQDETERNVMINQRIDITRIREFSHWVSEIHVDGLILKDRDKIDQLLNKLSRNPEVVNKVGETLSEFQRLSVIAMVAIPRVECPTCSQTDQKDLDISPYLIPQDAVSRFFTLAHQRF